MWVPRASRAADPSREPKKTAFSHLTPSTPADAMPITQITKKSRLPQVLRNPGALSREDCRREVLSKYSVRGDAIISKLILDESELSDEMRSKAKLEKLEEAKELTGQQDLIQHVELLDTELKACWSRGEKVKALRLAIQASKLLGHAGVPQCYPSIFILGSIVLETFGDLVAERLQATAASANFVVATLFKKGKEAAPDMIPPEAIEMCHNWFLKISSIRELLPRIYVELSLLKCYKYVARKIRVDMKEVVSRTAKQIRGVANPVVAAHVRWYLFFRAATVLTGPDWAYELLPCCEDCLATITDDHSANLFIPALQWMFDTFARYCETRQHEVVERIMAATEKKCPENRVAIAVAQLKAFSPAALICHLPTFVEIIEMADSFRRVELVQILCLALAEHPQPLPMSRSQKVALVGRMWDYMVENENQQGEFFAGAGIIMKFCWAHQSSKQVNLLLGEVRKRLELAPTNAVIEAAVFKALGGLANSMDPVALLLSDNFLPVVQWLPGFLASKLAMHILTNLPYNSVLSSAALELCRLLHQDLVDNASEESIAEVGTAIGNAIRACYSKDPEAELLFLCECRHTLPRLDAVKVCVIHEALKLVHKFVSNNHKRSVIKACFSFCHATIPAIMDIFSRMNLTLMCAFAAFQHGFVAQGELFMALCINTLKDVAQLETRGMVTRNNGPAILEAAMQLLAVGAIAPPHAKFGAFYIIDAVINWNDSHAWPESSSGRCAVRLAAIRALSHATFLDPMHQWAKCFGDILQKGPEIEEARNERCAAYLEACVTEMNEHLGSSPPQPVLVGEIATAILDTCVTFADCSKSKVARRAAQEAYFAAMTHAEATNAEYVIRLHRITSHAKLMLGDHLWGKVTATPQTVITEAAQPKVEI